MPPLTTLLRSRDVQAQDEAQFQWHTRLLKWLLVLGALSTVAYILLAAGFVDLHVYRTGGYAWLNGIDLYSDAFRRMVPGDVDLPFLYPPLAAVTFVPLHLLPWHVAKFVITALSAVALAATTLVVSRRIHGPNTGAVVLAMAVAVAWVLFEPARQTMYYGQINLILMGLVTVDCLLPRTNGSRWPRGLLVGLAAALKLTPGIFVLFFLLKRQYRAAAVAVGTFAGAGLLGFALAPRDSMQYWFGVLLESDKGVGIAFAFNQSVNGVLHRLLPEGATRLSVWLLAALGLFVVAWLAIRRARAAGDDITVLLVIAIWGLLASPISWAHHWVWIFPAAIAVLDVVRRKVLPRGTAMGLATVLTLVFAAGPHALVLYGDPATSEMDWSWWQHLLGSSYTVVAVAALITLAVCRRAPPARTSADESGPTATAASSADSDGLPH